MSRGSLLLAVLAASAAMAAPQGDAPLPTRECVKPLEKVAHEIAKAGRAEELDALLDVMRRGGMEGAAQEKLAAACRQEAAKAKKVQPSVPSVVKTLQKAASDLAALLPTASDLQRKDLAELVLRLDGRSEVAQRALGREKVGDEWLDATARARRDRRNWIARTLEEVRRMPIEIETGPSEHPLLAAMNVPGRSFARFQNVTLHGVWPAEKLARTLREVVRGLVLANALVRGKVTLPTIPRLTLVQFEDRLQYEAALDLAFAQQKIDAADIELARKLNCRYISKELVGFWPTEAWLTTSTLTDVFCNAEYDDERVKLGACEPAFFAGVTNWVALSLVGERLPVFLIAETSGGARGRGATTATDEREQKRRERLYSLRDAGIAGGRIWMQYLAQRHQDPPLADAFQDQLGKIQGGDLQKITFVVEMLIEDGPLFPVMKALVAADVKLPRPDRFAAAVGRPLSEFEPAWREWIVPQEPGLAERLSASAPEEVLSPGDRQTIDALNALRVRAGTGAVPVELDRATSDACRIHALYLAQNPEQAAHWPDAHEEYPDRKGFDPRGAWAGSHSVIAPGVKSGREALDGWMATFYHRLPLIGPGLLRIGFALEQGFALIDAGTFVDPPEMGSEAIGLAGSNYPKGRIEPWGIGWPPPGARDVPTRFLAELPEPVPGVDSATLGFPITLQLADRYLGRPEITLELHAGSAKDAVVPCWFSSPVAPTNPKLAPDDTWCLMPKSPLKPDGRYTVTGSVHIVGETTMDDRFEWTFQCGR